MIKIVGCNNNEAVNNLYYTLIPKFKLSEEDIEYVNGHTSEIFLSEELDDDLIVKIEWYCDGFLDGFEECSRS